MKNKVLLFSFLILCFTTTTAIAAISCGMLGSNFIEKSEKYCSEEKPFYGTGCGGCFGCDELQVLEVREFNPYATYIHPLEDIATCTNRTLVKSEWGKIVYESILTQCPPEAPLREEYGDCVSCDSTHRVYVKDSSDCNACPNMTAYPYESSYSDEKGWYCMRNACPETHPIRGEFACYECDKTGAINTSPEECAKCPNRKMQKVYEDELCILVNNSDPKKPLVDIPPHMVTDTDCADTALCSFPKSCDTEENVETTKENCDKCPNREYKDGKCVLISCDSEKIKTEAGCLSCDDVWWPMWSRGDEYHPTKADCDKCPNRVWDDEYHECRLIECPNGYFKSGENCYSCDKENSGRYSIQSTAEECAKCPERIYVDGECFIKGK